MPYGPNIPNKKKSKPQPSHGNFPGPGGVYPSEKTYYSHGNLPSQADAEKIAKPAPVAAKPAEKSTTKASPNPVVSAKGILKNDAASVRMSGGQQMLTTPFGIVGGAPLQKKKLLGS